jgi:anthranilate/para-aminobenzoate synthase component II
MNRKIYVVGSQNSYASWMEGQVVANMWDSDLVVFTGGEDVSPSLYGDAVHPETQCNLRRDLAEFQEFREARKLGKHMVGICRGAQFLCAMAGGRLVQHQLNPRGVHPMTTFDGETIHVTSTHHQAQYPWGMAANTFRVLGWTQGISDIHLDGTGKEIVKGEVKDDKEVEICHYPLIKGLGIQPHPEMMMSLYGKSQTYTKSIDYFRTLLNNFMKEFPRTSL